MRNTMNLMVTFSILLILVASGCATKDLNANLKSAYTADGFTITGNMVGNFIYAESMNSNALYTVYDNVLKTSFTVVCTQDDSLNAAQNAVAGYKVDTTVTVSTEHPGYFSCSYSVKRN